MKTFMKEIEMIANFTKEGVPVPIKYRILNEANELQVITVGKILWKKQDKRAGNLMITYSCQSVFSGVERRYELRYEAASFKWYLHKI